MPKKHDGLYPAIVNFQTLIAAAKRAVKGKRKKPGVAAFMANLENEVLRLERELQSGQWRPGRFVAFRVCDPKPRMISAAPFRDRVVHHALCHVVQPIFERGFVFDSYANRESKGSHRALQRYEQYRDRHAHVLRCDIFRYFPAIDHGVLKRDLRRRLRCLPTLRLCDRIIDGSNPQEPVEIYYPGDDLFAPFERKRGIPIGNLTSQFFANLYLDPLDHFVREVLRAPGYVRYVDDFAIFHDDAGVLMEQRQRIEDFLIGRRLKLHPRKTFIAPTIESAEFVGFVTAPGRRWLPEGNVRRFRNRLRGLRDQWRAGTVSREDVETRIQAWIAQAEHADSWRLRRAIFEGGWFDPASGPGRSPVLPRSPRRLLEQQSRQAALGVSQQEQSRQPEQHCRFSCFQHAATSESSGSRTA